MATTHQCASLYIDFTPDELHVSQILLELPLLWQKSEFSLGLPPAWPLRRKRSVLDSPPDSSSLPPPPSPSKKVKESSPTTPLLLNSLPLSRSESDENATAKTSKKKPSVDKKSQYLEAIDELTTKNHVLEVNVEAMKQRYNHLKAINSELKAQKQEIILGSSKNESANPAIETSNSAMKIVKFTVKSSSPTLDHHHHHHHHHSQFQLSMKNQTAPRPEQSKSQNFQIPIGAIPCYDPSLGPMGIPDLNISHEEISQRNYSKIMAARARQNRIQICKTKNANGATKLQSPNPCM